MEENLVLDIKNADGTNFNDLKLRKFNVSSTVMSLSDKIEGDVFYPTNTLAFTMNEYVMYNNVKYSLKIDNPPTILKKGITEDNGELKGMTKYSVTFYHPMALLYNIPFTDVAVTSDEDLYKSEDTTFFWVGTITELVAKINQNLISKGWSCVLQSGFIDDGKQSEVIQFNNQTIADVLKVCYETFKTPFVVDGYNILFGTPSNEILDSNNNPYVFKLGQGLGLKNNDRTPKNNKIITRIAGYGSETNIPFGYPKIQWTGNSSWNYTINNDINASGSYPIVDGVIDGENVRLIKHPFTRNHLMPSIYVDSVNKKINPYAVGYNKDTVLIDYYDAISDQSHTYINQINVDSPAYDKHEFSDIKPTIIGATYNGQAIDELKTINPCDNNGTIIANWDDSVDGSGNYNQSYFKVELYPLGFDLYAMAAITSAMSISMKSGACSACNFELGVDWEDIKTNFYVTNENGDVIFTPNGTQRDLAKYPDSTNTSISLVIKKDTTTFGTLMPNVYQKPIVGDNFVFLGIDMPYTYITSAQTLLDEAMKQYMIENNIPYYDYPLDFDEYFLTNNKAILAQIKTNAIIRFEYGSDTFMLSVKDYNISYGDKALPTYKITLTDDVSITLNQIGQVAEGLSKLGSQVAQLQAVYGKDILNEIANILSKVNNDTANGIITFNQGLRTNGNVSSREYVGGLVGGSGWNIGKAGNAELKSLLLREFLEVPELRYNRTDVQVGNLWLACGCGLVESVVPDSATTGVITLKLEENEIGAIAEDDICMGIFHSSNPLDNSLVDSDDGYGTFKFSGFYTCYFRITSVSGNKNETFTYALRSGYTKHPSVAMTFACYGNFTNTSRQSCAYYTRTYQRWLVNVNTWEFTNDNIAAQFGDLSNLIVSNTQLSGYSAYLNNIYFTGRIQGIADSRYYMEIDTQGDTFLGYGESKVLTCKVYNGYHEDLTQWVSTWSVIRDSGDIGSDNVWNTAHQNFNGVLTISDSDLGTNILSTLFTFTAHGNSEQIAVTTLEI